MNIKQMFIKKIFGPILNLIEVKFKISGIFLPIAIVLCCLLILIKKKNKNKYDDNAIIYLIIALIISFIAAIYDTIRLRG